MFGKPIFFTFLIPILVCISLVQGNLLKYTFEISYISGAPDGVYGEHIIGINGRFPGPTIEGELGDTVEVTIINNLQDGENVTIHWHGLRQTGTPFSDGPEMITQCPLKMGSVQVVAFRLEDAGSFWYHSHTKSQYTAGLWGVIIVRRVPEVYQYDEEIVVTFNEWYHLSFLENEHWFRLPIAPGPPPFPDSLLMNGMGRYPCNVAAVQGHQCSAENQMRSRFRVVRGKVYRIRAISTSGYPPFNFSIDGHQLHTIEVDGVDLKDPVVADVALIDAGQRYSFLLDTRPSPPFPSQFLIRAKARPDIMPSSMFNINEFPEILKSEKYLSSTAVLEYVNPGELGEGVIIDEDTVPFPYTESDPVKDYSGLGKLNERLLAPYFNYPFPEEDVVGTRVTVYITFGRLEDGFHQISFNYTPFVQPHSGLPLLARMLLDDASIYTDPNLHVYEVDYNKAVELVINNPVTNIHPLHLHGHHFWVVNMGEIDDGPYDPVKHKHNAIHRYKRDTISILKNSYVVLRWLADNPGFWLFHCHIDWHMVEGMALNFAEAAEEARQRYTIPESIKRMCEEHEGGPKTRRRNYYDVGEY